MLTTVAHAPPPRVPVDTDPGEDPWGDDPDDTPDCGPLSPRGIPWDDEDPEALLDWIIWQHEPPERAAELSSFALRTYVEVGRLMRALPAPATVAFAQPLLEREEP